MRIRIPGEAGAALLVTLLAILIVSALAVCVLDTATTETLIAANQASAQQALYTAEAGLERSLTDLLDAPDWTDVLAARSPSSFRDAGIGALPDGRQADLVALTRELQLESDSFYGGGANRPVWQLYAHAPLASLLPGGLIPLADYVVVWVADDPEEADNDPGRDSNGIVLMRSDGYAMTAARRSVEIAAQRRTVIREEEEAADEEGEVAEAEVSSRVMWWREVR